MDPFAAALLTTLARRPTRPGRGLAPMLEALEAKAGYSREHVIAVKSLALSIARELRLGWSERAALGRGALLHDVGKLTIPDEILSKPGPLDAEEWAVMREHSAAGAQMLAPIVRDTRILAIVRSHHERWDGRGYPDGLAGESIPLGARIVAVADSFQAMLEARPYRPAVAAAEAIEVIDAEAGRQFDPACVSAFGVVATAALRSGSSAPLPQPA
jgi:putative nucleotidyltransferase with HDIG domain